MDVFVARQPIFDKRNNVYGYELLFRSSIDNFYDTSLDGDHTTSKVVTNSLLVIGLDTIAKGKRAFINFTKNLIVRGAPAVIPKDLIAVEVLETVDFHCSEQPPTSVPAGGSVIFRVTFNPTGSGLRLARVRINSDDPDEAPYDFMIQGTGTKAKAPVYIREGDGSGGVLSDEEGCRMSDSGDPLGWYLPLLFGLAMVAFIKRLR